MKQVGQAGRGYKMALDIAGQFSAADTDGVGLSPRPSVAAALAMVK